MVHKMNEMADSGLNGGKIASPSTSPRGKGRKNKRKLADPSQLNAANIPSSLTEFPRYELPPLKSQNLPSDFCTMGIGSNLPKEEEPDSAGWDDPIACHLEELLSSNLHVFFRNAIKQIVACGYTEEVAQKAISGSGLYYGGDDLVSNIVNDTLSFLKNGKEGGSSRDYVFEDLQQLAAYTMLEMISLLREVNPSLSTVEAMWRLLIYDLNVLQACESERDISSAPGCKSGENSSGSTFTLSSDTQSAIATVSNPSESDTLKPSLASDPNHQGETLKFGSFPNLSNAKNSRGSEGATIRKEVASGEGVQNTSAKGVSEEKLLTTRKGRSKKELTTLRQKSSYMEKYRSYGKGAYRAGKLASIGGFLVEKRVKSPSDLPSVHTKTVSTKITTEVLAKATLADGSCHHLRHTSPDRSMIDNSSSVHIKDCVTTLPATDPDSGNSASSSSEKKSAPESEINSSGPSKALDYYAGIPYDESLGKYVPRDKKDELILKLVPKVQELQNELHSWTEWANQKVMQAARKLSKDQPELKALRKEKEEAEQYEKEKQLLEENTMKRLSEMEFALNNATNQLEKANSTVRRLEIEQGLLKKEMEAAKLRAAESAESCREAKERGQKALRDAQSWERQKALLQEDLKTQRTKLAGVQQEVAKAKNRQNQIEARWKQERAAKEKLLVQAAAIRKKREHLEAAAKAEEDSMKLKAENDMKYYTENIKKLETELAKLKLKSDSSKIAALKRGIDGSYGASVHESKSPSPGTKGNQVVNGVKGVAKMWDSFEGAKIDRERECVMCLSDEMTVVFLPCAHQVLCSKCNELHEKEGMKDCPSCRSQIQRRIQARFGR